MSRNTVTPEQQRQKIERAQRFRAVREDLDVTQPVFAERLTSVAEALGLDGVSYDVGDITKRETARKALEIEDYMIISALNPQRWPVEWLAFGRKLTKGTAAVARAVRSANE